MKHNGFFLVIEGVDGAGKTEIARRLLYILQRTHGNDVKITFEPHDPSCGGLYIRQVLIGKIRDVPLSTLALAFAANRADHVGREIDPFLTGGDHRIIICDRYYLSSLVYQTDDDLPIQKVMEYNANARRPDLTIFLNASNAVCYERMRRRAEDKQLFERNLGATRQKYKSAIEYLRRAGDQIIEVNADKSIPEVLSDIISALQERGPDWLILQQPLPNEDLLRAPSYSGEGEVKIADVARSFVGSRGVSSTNDGAYSITSLVELKH